MLTENTAKSDKIIYLGLFLISFAMVFTSAFSPFNFRIMHVDSAAYVTIAQGITRGFLPYRDFVDNKGPLLYLISAFGLNFGGFTGIWIIELIFMFVSVLFAYKTALFFGNKHYAFIATAFSFVIMLAFFNIHAGVEEYSMPFLMISLYIFVKYYFSPKQETGFVELILLGFCFSCAIMIRLNMFFLWFGFCVIIFIESIIRKRFLMLGKYLLGFSIGILIALIPIFLYLRINGITEDFYNQVVIAGGARGFEITNLKDITNHFYAIIHRNYSFIPLFFGLFWIITSYKKPVFGFYLAYTLSYFLTALFWAFGGAGGSVIHYNMMFIPYFIPVLTYITGLLFSAFSGLKAKNVILVLFFCLVFSEGLARYFYDLTKIFNNNTGIQLKNAGKMIDDNTNPGDTIIALSFAYIYPFTNRNAASKYFFQGSGLEHIQGANEEFINDIINNKPAIIVVYNNEGSEPYRERWHAPVYDLMNKEYFLLSDVNGYNLYKRKENP